MLVVGSVGKAKDRGPYWSAVWVASALFPGSGRFGLVLQSRFAGRTHAADRARSFTPVMQVAVTTL